MVESKSTNNDKDNKQYKICAGVNCYELGLNLLRIIYLNKIAGFCDFCARDLLHLKLVEKIE